MWFIVSLLLECVLVYAIWVSQDMLSSGVCLTCPSWHWLSLQFKILYWEDLDVCLRFALDCFGKGRSIGNCASSVHRDFISAQRDVVSWVNGEANNMATQGSNKTANDCSFYGHCAEIMPRASSASCNCNLFHFQHWHYRSVIYSGMVNLHKMNRHHWTKLFFSIVF